MAESAYCQQDQSFNPSKAHRPRPTPVLAEADDVVNIVSIPLRHTGRGRRVT